MILTHGSNSLERGGGGVTPPEGYELIQGIYGSYNYDIWFNGYDAPPALSGKTNSDIEMEVELFIRNTVSPNYESQIFATSGNAGRIYIKGNNDGTVFRIGALSGNSSYTPTYMETDISVAIGTKLTITLSQNALTVKYGTSVLTSSSIPYTNVSINDVILLFYPNNSTKPYAVSHAVIRDKNSGQNLVDIYPLKKISDGSCYCWDTVGNVFKGINLYEYQTADIGGREYPVIKIGNQLWLGENLDYKFSGCDIGPSGTPSTPAAWYYNNDESTYGANGNKYGLLYNWYAVDYLNQHLSELSIPTGWHVATENEFQTMINNSGLSQLSILPSGYYIPGSTSFEGGGSVAHQFTSTMYNAGNIYFFEGTGSSGSIGIGSLPTGRSIRLVKDAT